MKTITPTLLISGLIVAAFLGGLFYQDIHAPAPQKITLEQILSIRELHLVKHTYHDLFFLHRNKDEHKAMRAIVQVPVTITAYLNLKNIQLVYEGDSLRKVILPPAILDEPVYQMNQAVVRETRGFQVHAGKDLYPAVSAYLAEVIRNRMDTVRNRAIANRMLVQAEAEGKEYIESILHTLGREDVKVTFGDAAKDKAAAEYVISFQARAVRLK